VHEPPLFSLLNDDPKLAPVLEDTFRRVNGVLEKIGTGNYAGAAEQFVDSVALGPGGWAQIPSDARQSFIQNAPAFLDEAQDPEQLTIDLEKLKAFSGPALLTKGGRSPGLFAPVVERLEKVLEDADIVTFSDAGHIPHVTHPEVYADAVKSFIGRKSG
jgi:pimeloyl-ACP methyl ester carboxylesterase